MSVAGTAIEPQGKALNPTAVANYIENIKSDGMFDEPVLRDIAQGTEGSAVVYSWGLSFNFKYDDVPQPAPAGADAGAAPGGAPAATGG